MSTVVTTQQYAELPEGTQVTPADLTAYFTNIDNAAGWVLASLSITDALPSVNPVTVTPSGGLGLSIAGANQFMVCQGLVCDVCAVDSVTLATADTVHPRIDLIAVKAQRVTGSSTISRVVRADSATLPLVYLSGTLVAGTATIALPAGYTAAPAVTGVTPVGTGSTGSLRVTSISTTTVVISSTDAADTRSFNLQIFGNPTGSTGVATSIGLYENHPLWEVVTGTPSSSPAVPSTPSGYEAFATVAVGANVTTLTSAMITILFGTLPNLSGTNTVNAANGSTTLPGGVIMKWGALASVPADSSSSDLTVSFNAAFPNGAYQVVPSIDTGSSWSGNELSVQISSVTASGFKVTVSGGTAGSTVTVRYTALGD